MPTKRTRSNRTPGPTITRQAATLYHEARALERVYVNHLQSDDGCRGVDALPFSAKCADCRRYLKLNLALSDELKLPPFAAGPLDVDVDDDSCPWPAGTSAYLTWPMALEMKRTLEAMTSE